MDCAVRFRYEMLLVLGIPSIKLISATFVYIISRIEDSRMSLIVCDHFIH